MPVTSRFVVGLPISTNKQGTRGTPPHLQGYIILASDQVAQFDTEATVAEDPWPSLGKGHTMLRSQRNLCNLPYISREEFENACVEFADRSQKLGLDTTIVKPSDPDACIYLKISRQLPHESLRRRKCSFKSEYLADDCESLEDELIEDDDDAVVYKSGNEPDLISIDYHIILSQTYRVPVLYLCFKGPPPESLSNIDAAYEYLVPSIARAQIQAVGVLGGISMINHPFNDLPCLTIHPCNTGHAMQQLTESKKISGLEYLQLWIGLVGGLVGLNLSKELAIELEA